MDSLDKATILNSINNSNADRLQKLVDRKTIEENQTPSTVYVGQSDDGRSLVKPLGGAITPLRTVGNVQASVGVPVRAAVGSADAGTNIIRQQSRRSKEAIDLKILASGVDSSGTHIFIGGDRATPVEILILPPGETISFVRIENLGIGADRWIVAIKTVDSSENYKIYTKFGENPTADWQLVDVKAKILNYFGQGLWSGLLEKPPINFETVILPETIATPQTFFFANRPGEVRGVVNCGLTGEEFAFVPSASKFYKFAESRGFLSAPRDNLVPIREWNFTGTSTLDSGTRLTQYWVGQPSPPFYPFGSAVFLESKYDQNRNLVTQYPSFYAVNGTIQSYTGNYVYTQHRDSMSTYQERRFLGNDVPVPPGANYDIGFDDALTIGTNIQVGIGVSKPLRMDPGPRANLYQAPTVTFEIPTPIENFEGGLVYSKFTGISAFNNTGFVFSGFEPPYTSWVVKKYLRLEDGTEKEAKFSSSYRDYSRNYLLGNPGAAVPDLVSWRKEGQYPTLRDIGDLPPNSSQYTPAVSPLLKERWNWTVTMTQPVDNAGVIDYTAANALVKEKKIKTYAVTLADSLTSQKILDAR